MIIEAVQAFGGRAAVADIRGWIHSQYGDVNDGTIRAQIHVNAVNSPSRVHYPENQKPRLANTARDFLYFVGRGLVEVYEPARHGVWEIARMDSGMLVVCMAHQASNAAASTSKGGSAPLHYAHATTTGRNEPLTPADMGRIDRLDLTPESLSRGCELFEQNEGRDSMYRVATYLLGEGVWWGRCAEMADALTVLLLTWNGAFYRYGPLDTSRLEQCLTQQWKTIANFHNRDIASLGVGDRETLSSLFLAILEATLIASGTSVKKSPVSAAKALHLLAPAFLPIWDATIAKKYGCGAYLQMPTECYWRFCLMMQELTRRLRPHIPKSPKTLLKRIDEYNYARFSKTWTWAP
ncbi:MAG TPA: hypothetical protein VK821_17340 [Dehalococcoidia bacterium]|nr:hypothetical protein [Dehalococcoidia bacterium]